MKKIFGLAAGALVAAVVVPSLAQAQNAYTTTTVNLRAGPGFEYPIVFPVPGNVALQSYGCLDGYSWCDVAVNGYRGWMSGDYIGYVQEGRWVPVYDYGPRYSVPIISFNFGTYWDTHYRSRPFYSQRTRWESFDRDHHNSYAPLQHRAMPTVLPKVEADRWRNNNGKFDNNRSDNGRNDNGRNDNGRIDNNGRNTGDHNNDGHNDNGRGNIKTGDHNNDGHNDNGVGNQKNKTVVTPTKVDPPKQVVTPQPTKVAPVNQDANRRDDGNKGDKGNKGGGNDKDKGDDNGRGTQFQNNGNGNDKR